MNPESESFRFPHRAQRWAAAGVLVLGLIQAALADRKARLLGEAADPAYQRTHPIERITADELASHIMDGVRRLLPVDVRDVADFAKTSLPGAVNIQPATMLGKEWRDVFAQEQNRKAFFAQDEAAALRAATLATIFGYKNVAVLQGGLDGFNHTILQASVPSDGLPEVELETARFRARATTEIATLIKQRGGVKPVRRIKKVQGGCGI